MDSSKLERFAISFISNHCTTNSVLSRSLVIVITKERQLTFLRGNYTLLPVLIYFSIASSRLR